MLYKLMIDSENIDNSCSLENRKVIKVNEKLSENLYNYILSSSNGVINMEAIQEKVTPIIKNIDVFISYDHADYEKACYLAECLENCGYKVFLDSLFWKSVDGITNLFNKRYNLSDDGKTYNYKKTKKTISTFNMILTDSIIETVRNSKIFIFIRNQDLQNDYRTESPWIYLENKIATNCVYPQNKALFEDSQNAPQIRFKLVFKGKIFYSINEIIKFIRSNI